MRTQTFCLGLLACFALVSATSLSAKAPSVEARIAEQNALFDEYYESDLKSHPEMATAYGDYRYNDQLNDYSVAGANSQHDRDVQYLARLKGISTQGFSATEALSHDVMRRMLEQRIANYEFKEFEMPVNQM